MRKTPEQKIAELEAAQDKIKERLKREKGKLKAVERKNDTRRKVIVGSIVLAHAENNEDFAAKLWEILDQQTLRVRDREFLGLPANEPPNEDG